MSSPFTVHINTYIHIHTRTLYKIGILKLHLVLSSSWLARSLSIRQMPSTGFCSSRPLSPKFAKHTYHRVSVFMLFIRVCMRTFRLSKSVRLNESSHPTDVHGQRRYKNRKLLVLFPASIKLIGAIIFIIGVTVPIIVKTVTTTSNCSCLSAVFKLAGKFIIIC